MRIAWAKTINEQAGNTYGYSVASHGYQQALWHAGYTITPAADLVLHWGAASNYAPVPGKRNIAGLVCESLNLHPSFQRVFDHPDTTAIFTPSTFCQQVFQKYTTKPVYVCGHGVDGAEFPFVERTWTPLEARTTPFTFLYVGARNPRKGVDFLEEWWSEMGLYRQRGVRLYLKMTLGPKEHAALDDAGIQIEEVWTEGNVVCDIRNLSPRELCGLYHQAHCFVLPSRGEGFGLTLAEAMATGLPCIATRFGGHLDYCDDESAYLVEYRPAPFLGTDGTVFVGARPDPKHFCEHVLTVLGDYAAAVQRGRLAAARVQAQCTTQQVSEQLRRMVTEVASSGSSTHPARQSG